MLLGSVMLAPGLALTGCGSGQGPGHAAPATAPTLTHVTAPPARGLLPYLFSAGDGPESVSGAPQSAASLSGWVAYTGLGASDAQRLRVAGFRAGAQETLSGQASAGVSFVEAFRSAGGARSEVVHRAAVPAQAGTRVRRFSAAGLPNAHGVAISQQGSVGTNLYWTEGRCAVYLGDAAATGRIAEVEAGARAIFRRTHGVCP